MPRLQNEETLHGCSVKRECELEVTPSSPKSFSSTNLINLLYCASQVTCVFTNGHVNCYAYRKLRLASDIAIFLRSFLDLVLSQLPHPVMN